MDSHPGMRNRIAHEYFILNFETICTTIEAELPRLIRQVDSITDPAQ